MILIRRVNNMLYSFGVKLSTVSLFLFFIQFASAQKGSDRIQLNQLGFYPSSPKLAVITGKTNAAKFYITSPTKQDTFFTGSLSPEKQSQYSAAITRVA